jgi:hypothetical protein
LHANLFSGIVELFPRKGFYTEQIKRLFSKSKFTKTLFKSTNNTKTEKRAQFHQADIQPTMQKLVCNGGKK